MGLTGRPHTVDDKCLNGTFAETRTWHDVETRRYDHLRLHVPAPMRKTSAQQDPITQTMIASDHFGEQRLSLGGRLSPTQVGLRQIGDPFSIGPGSATFRRSPQSCGGRSNGCSAPKPVQCSMRVCRSSRRFAVHRMRGRRRFAVLRRAVLVNGLINSTPVTSASIVRVYVLTADGRPEDEIQIRTLLSKATESHPLSLLRLTSNQHRYRRRGSTEIDIGDSRASEGSGETGAHGEPDEFGTRGAEY